MKNINFTFSIPNIQITDCTFLQGTVVRKDFNIMEEAGGAVGKGIYEDFDATVDGSTLEIHLYWSGKGTNFVPNKGVYGPLISAIAVTPSDLPLGFTISLANTSFC